MRMWWILGAVNGFLAVALGAFGAHGLKTRLEANATLDVFETASRYHMYHALALLAVGWLASRAATSLTTAAGWCFLGGTVLFSGSLYVLALTGFKKLGMITPFGGALFLAAWVLVALAAARLK